MKPFLILQLRPETEASDDEYAAFLAKGELAQEQTRRIRLESEPLPRDIDLADYAGVIVGGGPGCVSDREDEKSDVDKRIEAAILSLMPAIVESDIPYLGCCYGIGILAHFLGSTVNKERYGESVGAVKCQLTAAGKADRILSNVPNQFMAFVGHKEALQQLPEGCRHLLSSEPCPYQMIRYKNNIYATQFHPEADSEVFEARIRLYRNSGYFPSEKAEEITRFCHQQDVHAPVTILKNFINAYR